MPTLKDTELRVMLVVSAPDLGLEGPTAWPEMGRNHAQAAGLALAPAAVPADGAGQRRGFRRGGLACRVRPDRRGRCRQELRSGTAEERRRQLGAPRISVLERRCWRTHGFHALWKSGKP